MSNKIYKSARLSILKIRKVKTLDKNIEKDRISKGKKEYYPVNSNIEELTRDCLKFNDINKTLVNWAMKDAAQHFNDEDFIKISDNINPFDDSELNSQSIEAVKQLGYSFKEYYNYINMKAVSRAERITRGTLHSLLKSHADKIITTRKIKDNEYVSNGKKRTLSLTPPKAGNQIDYGYVDKQYYRTYTELLNENIIEIRLVIYNTIYSVYCLIPDGYYTVDSRICPIRISFKNNKAVFNLPLEYDQLYPSISKDYVIGVDIGQLKPYVASVIRTKDKSVVKTIQCSRRLASLARDVRVSQEQLGIIQSYYWEAVNKEKNYYKNSILNNLSDYQLEEHYKNLIIIHKYDKEIKDKRNSIVRKKKEVAKLVGQEVNDLSLEWNCAVIAVEKLDWVVNTTNNHRWNFSETIKWIKHYARLQGGLCYKVSAKNTSTTCSNCESDNIVFNERTLYCSDCKHNIDRDDNASVNIGVRVIDSAVKSSNTRKLKRKKKSITSGNSSSGDMVVRVPVRRESLKPVRDRSKNASTRKRVKVIKKVFNVVSVNDVNGVLLSNFIASCTERGVGDYNDMVISDFDRHASIDNYDNYNLLL